MKCLLVFDHLNDVVYTKYDEKFSQHIRDFAAQQGFVNPEVKVDRKFQHKIKHDCRIPMLSSTIMFSYKFFPP
jgi:hypothetical protein